MPQTTDLEVYFPRWQTSDFHMFDVEWNDRLLGPVRAVIQSKGVPPSDVDELVGETLLVVLQKMWQARSYAGLRQFARWNARNVLKRYFRRERRVMHVPPDFLDVPTRSMDPSSHSEDACRVRDAVRRLNANQATMINLVYFVGMRCCDASDFLGITRRAGYERLGRAIRNLRRLLRET